MVWGSLYEDNYSRFFQYTFHLWMPDLFFLFKLTFLYFAFSSNSIKNLSHIFCLHSKSFLLVGLSQKNCRGMFDIELFERFRAFLAFNGDKLDLWVLPKERDHLS